jgi:hypothetical protein
VLTPICDQLDWFGRRLHDGKVLLDTSYRAGVTAPAATVLATNVLATTVLATTVLMTTVLATTVLVTVLATTVLVTLLATTVLGAVLATWVFVVKVSPSCSTLGRPKQRREVKLLAR